jgi:hypothetical protein
MICFFRMTKMIYNYTHLPICLHLLRSYPWDTDPSSSRCNVLTLVPFDEWAFNMAKCRSLLSLCVYGAKRKENVCYMLDPHSTDVAIGLIQWRYCALSTALRRNVFADRWARAGSPHRPHMPENRKKRQLIWCHYNYDQNTHAVWTCSL